jgi:heat shock protein HspQ
MVSAESGHFLGIFSHRLFPIWCRVQMDKDAVKGLVNLNGEPLAMLKTDAKYHIGQVLRHRKHPFRGVVFDVDAMFSNTQDWYEAIPEDARPAKNQPFYHLLAENDQSYYVAYVSEQNLVPDETGEPVTHPDLPDLFGDFEDGRYPLQFQLN